MGRAAKPLASEAAFALVAGCIRLARKTGMPMRRSTSFTMLAAITLAGCGSGGEDSAQGASETTPAATHSAAIQPCSLVTTAEVGQIIGDKVVAARPGEGSCTYETADAQGSSVTIELNRTDARAQMEMARSTTGALQDIGAEAARQGGAAGRGLNAALGNSGGSPKLGDQAFFGPNAQLSVLEGNSYLAISPPVMRSRMSGANPTLTTQERKLMAVVIAKTALTRLP